MSFKRALPGILLCACLVLSLSPSRTLQAAAAPGWTTLSTAAFASEPILDLAVSPAYALDRTLFVLTFGTGFNLWRTQDGALSWQKVLAGSGSVQLNYIGLSPDYGNAARVVYLLGSAESGPALWYSPDAGSTWSVRPAPEGTGAPNPFLVASDSGLYLAGFDAVNNQAFVRYSASGGVSFSAAVSAGSLPLCSMALSPGYAQDHTLLTGNTDGGVLCSSDGGGSFQPVSATALTGVMRVAFDENFAATRAVYTISDASGGGIYSASVGAGQPWQRLDTAFPSDERLGAVAVSSTGVLYAASSRLVNTASSRGGLLRCLSPVTPALFERVTAGLSDGAGLCEGSLRCADNQLWAIDSANNSLVTFADSLSQPVNLIAPAHNSAGIGVLSGNSVSGISLSWQTLEAGTAYQWQLSTASNFSVIPNGFSGNTAGTSVSAPSLAPVNIYFWRVRVTAPFYSPWSAVWCFSTPSPPVPPGVPQLLSPPQGNVDVILSPFFHWSQVPDASSYELVVSKRYDYANPVISRTGVRRLATNFWQSDVVLDYSTLYFWRVRAVGSSGTGSWTDTGIFTTLAAAVPASTVAPSSTAPSTTLAVTTALAVSTSPPLVSTSLHTAAPAATASITMLPPTPVLTVTSSAPTTDVQSPVTAVAPSTNVSPPVLPQISGETPDWVYYALAGGGSGLVLLSAIILLASSRKKPLL